MRILIFLILNIFIYQSVFSQKINCGLAINHPKRADGNPLISRDGQTLYFSRGNCEEAFTCETDIYVSTLQKNGQWSKAKPIMELNNQEMNAIVFLYPNENKIILKDGYTGKSGFAESYKTDSGWTSPQHIEFQDEPVEWKNHNCKLSSNEQVMILSNNGDMFVSFWNENEKLWSKPEALKHLNSSDTEFTPFLAADDRTLYFSSGGWGGEGQNDIVKSTRLDSTWKNWSSPVPIGSPVNSPDWESFFCISALADSAWVYSRIEGNGDLYKVALTEQQKPKPVLLLEAKVLDARYKRPMKAFVQILNASDFSIVSTLYADPISGEFNTVLDYGNDYIISAQIKDYISVSEKLEIPDSTIFQKFSKEIIMYPLEKGQKIILNHVSFNQSSYELQSESTFELDRIVEILQVNPQINLQIAGHTDNVGDPILNQQLSEQRAEEVKKYLIRKGISAQRLRAIGYGKTKPIGDNRTEAGRILNRRVEIIVF